MPKPAISRLDEIKFRDLLVKWKRETMFQSFPHQMANSHYLEIIGMGRDVAVPLILREFQKGKMAHLFSALKELTGEDPVPPDHRGNIQSMAGDWIRWGQRKGFIE